MTVESQPIIPAGKCILPGRVLTRADTMRKWTVCLCQALPVLVGLFILDAIALEADAAGGIRGFLGAAGTRTRIIQFCALTMAVALFIMLKKFAPDDLDRTHSRHS